MSLETNDPMPSLPPGTRIQYVTVTTPHPGTGWGVSDARPYGIPAGHGTVVDTFLGGAGKGQIVMSTADDFPHQIRVDFLSAAQPLHSVRPIQ